MATATAPVKEKTDDEQISAGFSPNRVIGFAIYPDSHVHAISATFLQGHKAFKSAKLSAVPLGAPADAEKRIPYAAPIPDVMLDDDAWSGLWYPDVNAIGIDYVMSPILRPDWIGPYAVEEKRWKSGRLNAKERGALIYSHAVTERIYQAALGWTKQRYSDVREVRWIAYELTKDVQMNAYANTVRSAKQFTKGVRNKPPFTWTGGTKGLIRALVAGYLPKAANRIIGQWQQYRLEEYRSVEEQNATFVPATEGTDVISPVPDEGRTPRPTANTPSFDELVAGANKLVYRAPKVRLLVEPEPNGAPRLNCPVCNKVRNAERTGDMLETVHKLDCGGVRRTEKDKVVMVSHPKE